MLMTHAAAAVPPDVAARVRTYRHVLRVNIVLNVLIGLFVLIGPYAFANLLHLAEPFPASWMRLWGLLLIALSLLYIPGLMSPLRNRYPNVMGVAIRLALALFFLAQGGGFVWIGIYEALFGLILLFTYRSALRANLMSKP